MEQLFSMAIHVDILGLYFSMGTYTTSNKATQHGKKNLAMTDLTNYVALISSIAHSHLEELYTLSIVVISAAKTHTINNQIT